MLNIIKEKYGSKMTKDVVWTFIIQMIIMLCSFIITKLLSNRLNMDEFGQYNLIKRSIQVLSFMMLAGVGITLPRYIPLESITHLHIMRVSFGLPFLRFVSWRGATVDYWRLRQ